MGVDEMAPILHNGHWGHAMTRPTGSTSSHGWFTFFLLAVVQISVVWAIQEAGWLAHSQVLLWVSLAGLATGAIFARPRSHEELLHLLSLFVGVGVLLLAGASTLSKGVLAERIGAIAQRFFKWLETTRSGGIGTDSLLFLLFLAAIAWLVAYFGAWYAFRRQSGWIAVSGAGASLVIAVSYSENLGRYFFLFAPAAILLFAHLNATRQAREWSRLGIDEPSRLHGKFLWQGLAAGLLLVFLASWAPGIATHPNFLRVYQMVERPWYDLQNELARYFGPIQVGTAGASTYGPTLALQSGVSLTDSVVMEVRMTDARRLRAVTYDRYTGQGWVTLDKAKVDVPANDPALEAASAYKERRDLEQTIRLHRTKGDLLFAASLPKSVSVATRAEIDTFTAGQGGGEIGSYADLGAVRAAVGPFRGQEYTVISSISRASAEALRGAGNDYPQRIWQRYTALPRSVPTRVRALAASITRGKTTTYDKVVAVESYLRSLTYSLKPPVPPEGRDVVDFFLFDSKEGYCDYFSSSMVVMLRSLGIPARVVAGYLPGNWDADRDAYLVRESDSHSWPEVYFPQYGWVEFEPTASAPEVARPQTVAEAEALNETSAESEQVNTTGPALLEDVGADTPPDEPSAADQAAGPGAGFQLPSVPPEAILGFLGVLLAGLVTYRGALLVWERQFRGLTPAETAYAKMGLVARWSGRGRRPQQTPYEYAESLSRAVPALAPAIRLIVRAFVRQRFARRAGDPEEPGMLATAWRSLRLSLPRGLFLGNLRRLGRLLRRD